MKLAALPVPGVVPDDWTVAPLFALEDAALTPRPPGCTLVEDPAEADLGALPALWSAYRGPARDAVGALLDQEHAAGRRVVVWVDGDQEIDLDHPAAILFEQGPEAARPRRHATVHAWPVLIHDHLADLYDGDPAPRPHADRPQVGFCGQAAAPLSGHARLVAGKVRAHLAHRLGRTDRLPSPWASHLRLRHLALGLLAADDRIEVDFVIRDRYRAGVRDLAERTDRTHPTATDFYDNIRANAYTLCVRGGGNFSTRLYETLCLGRIPIIVDTGLVLPWVGDHVWDELAVVVPAADLDQLADRVVAHHAALDDEAFLDAQRRCRALWVDRLSVDGFFTHLPELLGSR